MKNHTDHLNVIITNLGNFELEAISTVIKTLALIVDRGHKINDSYAGASGSIPKAQLFEEGKVYLAVQPSTYFPTHAYMMKMTNIKEVGACTRMHVHTGPRFGFLVVGKNTSVRFASLSPVHNQNGEIISLPEKVEEEIFHILKIDAGQMVSLQIPTGTSHQFNAYGEEATMLSIHIEDHALGSKDKPLTMVGQTTFLQDHRDPLGQCT